MRLQKNKVVIVGGGISGMATAYYLLKLSSDVEVRLIEKNSALGGLIATKENEFGLVETAANGFLNSEEVEKIFADLNISVSGKVKPHRKRYIFRKDLRSFPLYFSECLKLVLFGIKYLFLRKMVRPYIHETVAHWGNRVLGTKLTKEVLEVGLQGLYGGDSAKLQANLVLPPFSLFKSKPSPPKIVKGTVAPLDGMGSFINALENWLLKNGCTIEKNHEVTAADLIQFQERGERVILAQNIVETAKLLKSISDPRGEILENVGMKGLVTCTCFYESASNDLRGFGVLFKEQSQLQPLGVLFNNDIFPDRKSRFRSETSIFSESAVSLSDDEILNSIGKVREKIGQKKIQPLSYSLTRWPQALPVYGEDLQRALALIQLEKNEIYLIGNYLGQIGLAKILISAKKLAARITQKEDNL